MQRVLQVREPGLYCPAGDFYINPTRPVNRALVTHAQPISADSCLTTKPGEALLRGIAGADLSIESYEYGQSLSMGDTRVSLHPAGFILGSAQIRIEHQGRITVVASDYKLAPDPTCTPFEPLRCHTFVTGAAFALPIFRWPSGNTTIDSIEAWYRANQETGKSSVLFAEPLGDAQRLLASLQIPVESSAEIERINEIYRAQGIPLKTASSGLKLVAPGAEIGRSAKVSTARASGWMRIRGTRRRQSLDRGFVFSNHADWGETLSVIDETHAETIWVTHGYRAPLVRWLQEHGRETVALEL